MYFLHTFGEFFANDLNRQKQSSFKIARTRPYKSQLRGYFLKRESHFSLGCLFLAPKCSLRKKKDLFQKFKDQLRWFTRDKLIETRYMNVVTRQEMKEICVLSSAKIKLSVQRIAVLDKKKLRKTAISTYSAKTRGLFHETSLVFRTFSLLLEENALLFWFPCQWQLLPCTDERASTDTHLRIAHSTSL